MGELEVTVTTWDKPNYELFDGESENHRVKNFVINQAGTLCRSIENEVYFEEEGRTSEGNKLEQFVLSQKDRLDDLWIQSMNEQQIRQNDIIKLGKKVLKVISISSNEGIRLAHYQDVRSHIDNSTTLFGEHPDAQCRVCLNHSATPDNPLLSLCKCCGSAQYLHYICLRTWLNGKLQIRQTQFCIEINSKSVSCEICRSYYPSLIYVGPNAFMLYNIENLNLSHHVVLEDVQLQTLLVLNFMDQKQLTIGRGHESNVKISEITISRKHVAFVLRDEKLFIQDERSKFGTLIKVQKPWRMDNNSTLHLQSGRSRIMVKHKVIRKRCALFCNLVD